jgi:hypothetical protein
MKDINNFGTSIIDGSLVNHSSYNKGWNQIPEKYRTRDNFNTFTYMNYWGMDAVAMFFEKIFKLENKVK